MSRRPPPKFLCGLCGLTKSGILYGKCRTCRNKNPKRCSLCAGQPWRVVGPKCRRCGLLFRAEPDATLGRGDGGLGGSLDLGSYSFPAEPE